MSIYHHKDKLVAQNFTVFYTMTVKCGIYKGGLFLYYWYLVIDIFEDLLAYGNTTE